MLLRCCEDLKGFLFFVIGRQAGRQAASRQSIDDGGPSDCFTFGAGVPADTWTRVRLPDFVIDYSLVLLVLILVLMLVLLLLLWWMVMVVNGL